VGSAPALPHWPPGTVAVLSTAGRDAHAIPVSTAVRAGDACLLFALGRGRESLARLRADPRVALTLMAAGDVAVTAYGRASVAADPLPGADGVVAVRLDVERVCDHARPAFAIEAGVAWRWTDAAAADRDEQVRRDLLTLVARGS
jgi:hypothetical protein